VLAVLAVLGIDRIRIDDSFRHHGKDALRHTRRDQAMADPMMKPTTAASTPEDIVSDWPRR
jgi:hypothetical protein